MPLQILFQPGSRFKFCHISNAKDEGDIVDLVAAASALLELLR